MARTRKIDETSEKIVQLFLAEELLTHVQKIGGMTTIQRARRVQRRYV